MQVSDAGFSKELRSTTGIGGVVSASFQYDAFGRRIAKSVGGAPASFLYDGANAIQESSGSANILTGDVDEFFQRNDGSDSTVPITDALGSVLALVGSNGLLKRNTATTHLEMRHVLGTSAATRHNMPVARTTARDCITSREILQSNSAAIHFRGALGLADGIDLYAYAGNDPLFGGNGGGTGPGDGSGAMDLVPGWESAQQRQWTGKPIWFPDYRPLT